MLENVPMSAHTSSPQVSPNIVPWKYIKNIYFIVTLNVESYYFHLYKITYSKIQNSYLQVTLVIFRSVVKNIYSIIFTGLDAIVEVIGITL